VTTIEQITFTNLGITQRGMCMFVKHIMCGTGEFLREEIKDISFKKVNKPDETELIIRFEEPVRDKRLRALLVIASDEIGEDFMSVLQATEELHTSADRIDPEIADAVPKREGELPLNNDENTQPQGTP